MDHIWAAERNWPQSMNLPSDSSKGVYLLEAYHYLHCLVCYAYSVNAYVCANASNAAQHILRETLWEAVDQKPYTHPPDSRIDYCFDTLWQVLIHPFFLLSVHGLYSLSLLFSIYSVTLIAHPSIHSVASLLAMVSYTGAKTGISFGILQRGIRRVLVVVLGFVIRLRIGLWAWKKMLNEDFCSVISGRIRWG